MTSEAAPSGRLYVHIGAPKTGTSYLQSLMWADRDRFREAGVHLPGKGQKAHFAAGGDLLGKVGDDYLQQVNRDHKPGAWDRLAAKIRRSDSPGVLVTDERLSGATPDAIARVAALGTDRTIHVVDRIGGQRRGPAGRRTRPS